MKEIYKRYQMRVLDYCITTMSHNHKPYSYSFSCINIFYSFLHLFVLNKDFSSTRHHCYRVINLFKFTFAPRSEK